MSIDNMIKGKCLLTGKIKNIINENIISILEPIQYNKPIIIISYTSTIHIMEFTHISKKYIVTNIIGDAEDKNSFLNILKNRIEMTTFYMNEVDTNTEPFKTAKKYLVFQMLSAGYW